MRLEPQTDGRPHGATNPGADDHHSAPRIFDIDNTTQVIGATSNWNMDIALPNSDFQVARVMMMGKRRLFGAASNLRESAEIHVTRDTSEAMGHSIRDAQAVWRIYAATYSKAAGELYLTMRIFDDDDNPANRHIGIIDAVITGSTLRLTFRNFSGSAQTLWVKGKALVW